MSALIFAIVKLLHMVISTYIWIIIISAVFSFIRPDPYNQIVQAIYKLTEPVYQYLRQNMPFLIISGVDLTPLVLILGLQFIDTLMIQTFLG